MGPWSNEDLFFYRWSNVPVTAGRGAGQRSAGAGGHRGVAGPAGGAQIADSSSTNAVNFSSARTIKCWFRAAMRISNEGCSPARIQGWNAAPTPTGLAEIVSDDFLIFHVRGPLARLYGARKILPVYGSFTSVPGGKLLTSM